MGMDQAISDFRKYLVIGQCLHFPGICIYQLPDFAFSDEIQIC